MARSPLKLSPAIETYLNQQHTEHPVLQELVRETACMEWASMQISPGQASFMSWLVKLLKAQRTIEVGVFTGYSSLATALALPEHGKLLACDESKEWTDIARRYWQKADVTRKIELVLGKAANTLEERIAAGEAKSFDFAFIDADKESYLVYYELCLRLLRRGGVMMFDNTLWGGSVPLRTDQRETTQALRALNRHALSDHRVESSIVPVGDGLTLVTKL